MPVKPPPYKNLFGLKFEVIWNKFLFLKIYEKDFVHLGNKISQHSTLRADCNRTRNYNTEMYVMFWGRTSKFLRSSFSSSFHGHFYVPVILIWSGCKFCTRNKLNHWTLLAILYFFSSENKNLFKKLNSLNLC